MASIPTTPTCTRVPTTEGDGVSMRSRWTSSIHRSSQMLPMMLFSWCTLIGAAAGKTLRLKLAHVCLCLKFIKILPHVYTPQNLRFSGISTHYKYHTPIQHVIHMTNKGNAHRYNGYRRSDIHRGSASMNVCSDQNAATLSSLNVQELYLVYHLLEHDLMNLISWNPKLCWLLTFKTGLQI